MPPFPRIYLAPDTLKLRRIIHRYSGSAGTKQSSGMRDVDGEQGEDDHPAIQDVEVDLCVYHTTVPAARQLDDPIYGAVMIESRQECGRGKGRER